MLDRLMWSIMALIWRNVDRKYPTFYTLDNFGTVQREIVEALTTGQYVTISVDGILQAAATWYLREDGVLIVTNAAANKGYMRPLVKAIRADNTFQGAIWHRNKHDAWRDFPRQRGIKCGN